MSALEKATLQRLTADENPTPEGDAIPVQFNPATLRLALSNEVEGGDSQGRQARHFNGKSSTDLSFDLVFDTADEANGEEPRSVRERTALVEQFVVPMPAPSDSSQRLVPPRVRFVWGDLQIDGIIEKLDIDFEHFAENGVPLRAKMAVAIKEQDSRYELLVRETASGSSPAPTQDGRGAAAPGALGALADGLAFADSTGFALGGETLADFGVRMGLDASAWRGLAAGIDASLSLEAGLEIDFSAGISAELGLGATAGFAASAGVSVEASLGIDASVGADIDAGFAVTAAGGVVAAVQTSAAVAAAVAALETKAAFGVSAATAGAIQGVVGKASSAAPSVSVPTSASASVTASAVRAAASGGADRSGASGAEPLLRSGLPTPGVQLEAAPVSALPRVDPRATSFGRGAPLNPRRVVTQSTSSLGASTRKAGRPAPGAPPWVSPPSASAGRRRADQESQKRSCSCGPSPRRKKS